MGDRQVGRVADPVDQTSERPVRYPLERSLPRVADPHLEGRDAEAVAALLGDVGDESLLDHGVDEVVRRGAWQVEGGREPSRGTGSGWAARKRSTISVLVAAGTWLMTRT